MRIARNQIVPAVVAAGVFMLTAAALSPQDQGTADPQEFQPRQEQRISLNFGGGTVYDFLQAVRTAAPSANIVIDDMAKQVLMGPAELTETSVESAVMLVEGMRGLVEGAPIALDADFINARGTSRPIFRVRAERVDDPRVQQTSVSRPSPPVISRVWSVADLTPFVEADDILSAVETALALHESAGEPKIRYHEPTSLLIARADPEQVDAIEQVINQLHGTAGARHRAAREQREPETDARYTALKGAVAEVRARLEAIEKKLSGD